MVDFFFCGFFFFFGRGGGIVGKSWCLFVKLIPLLKIMKIGLNLVIFAVFFPASLKNFHHNFTAFFWTVRYRSHKAMCKLRVKYKKKDIYLVTASERRYPAD